MRVLTIPIVHFIAFSLELKEIKKNRDVDNRKNQKSPGGTSGPSIAKAPKIFQRTWPQYNAVSRSCCEVTITKMLLKEERIESLDTPSRIKWMKFIKNLEHSPFSFKNVINISAHWTTSPAVQLSEFVKTL